LVRRRCPRSHADPGTKPAFEAIRSNGTDVFHNFSPTADAVKFVNAFKAAQALVRVGVFVS
jgi:hypothetical protein